MTRRYLGIFFGLTAAVCLGVGAVNLAIDPLDVFGMPKFDGFNAIKVDVDSHVRLAKALQVRRMRPATVIVGSSRALLGLDPASAVWPPNFGPVYNLSLYGGYLYEAMRYYQHALALGSVKHAVIAVDLWMFDRDWTVRPGFDESLFLVDKDGRPQKPNDIEPVRVLFSLDLLRASLRTVGRQDKLDTLVQRSDGFSSWRDETVYPKTKESHRAQFGYMERMFGTSAWAPERERRWMFDDPANPQPALAFYRQMIRDSFAAGIDARVVMLPSHARIWETLKAGGMWRQWEAWKREIVRITDEEAVHAARSPYPIWDFSGYNTVTTEAVPNDQSPMRYYWDGSHFKTIVGDMVLARIYDRGTPPPADFGHLLTPETMQATFAATRAARETYAVTHQRDVHEAGIWAK